MSPVASGMQGKSPRGESLGVQSPSGFVSSQVNVLFRRNRASSLCRELRGSRCRRQRCRRFLSMSADGKNLTENSEVTNSPEFVDIGAGDLRDEDIDILKTLGTELEVYTEKRKKMRRRTSALVDEILLEPESELTSDADELPPIEEDESTEYVRTAVRAADKRKAESILALRVSKLTYICSFVIIATGNNAPQVRAIGNLIEEDLAKNHKLDPRRRDGTANCGWLLLDCTWPSRFSFARVPCACDPQLY